MTEARPSKPVQLHCVAPHLIAGFWPHVVDLISRAFIAGFGDETAESTYRKLVNERAQLWIVWSDKAPKGEIVAAATTEVVQSPTAKICYITACGGRDLRKWERFMSDLERFALAEGCSKLRIHGRPGWARVLQGFRQPYIVLERDLGGGDVRGADYEHRERNRKRAVGTVNSVLDERSQPNWDRELVPDVGAIGSGGVDKLGSGDDPKLCAAN